MGFVEAGIAAFVGGYAVTGAAELAGGAAVVVLDMRIARRRFQTQLEAVVGMARNNVDDPEKGVGAVGGGVRAAHDLDALDVFNRERDIVPVDGGEAGLIDGAAVDHDLHATAVAIGGTVVADDVIPAVARADRCAGYEAEDFGELTHAA